MEPSLAEAILDLRFRTSVDISNALDNEVRRRNVAYPLAPAWTLDRLLEEIIKEWATRNHVAVNTIITR